jgi:hypothetical protein
MPYVRPMLRQIPRLTGQVFVSVADAVTLGLCSDTVGFTKVGSGSDSTGTSRPQSSAIRTSLQSSLLVSTLVLVTLLLQ